MKKIALMTWTTYENYGTFLQWYALSKEIEYLGYNCVSISYVPKTSYRESLVSILKRDFIEFCKIFFDKLQNILNKREIKSELRHNAFENFKKENFQMTDTCITASDLFSLNGQFDAYVCGSDQIWSPLSFNGHFYLDFVDCKSKKVAYAPSMGVNAINSFEKEQQIKAWLENIENISVRESAGKKIIDGLLNSDVPVVLDPTLLVDVEHWEKLLRKDYQVPENYLLCYFLGQNEKYWKEINKFAKKQKLKIVIIPVFKCDFKRDGIVRNDIGPKEFLTLIKNATYVCTDSFHGSVFSLLFEKKFLIFKRFKDSDLKNQNSRIYNLISLFDLSEHLYEYKDGEIENKINNQIDSIKINKVLVKKRKESKDYLSFSLNKAVTSSEINEFKTTNTCSGCGGCVAVCKNNAITMKINKAGFYQANIDNELCTKCGLCRKVCPFFNNNGTLINNSKIYSVKSKNPDVLKVSSSGGLGYELMNLYKNKKAAVVGCLMDENFKAVSKCVDFSKECYLEDELKKFQGSKYLQSDFSSVFEEILSCKSGIITGTPCQISAIKKFLVLNKRDEDFLLVELICHGVPSYNLWNKYLLMLKDDEYKILNITFRDKKFGWHKKVLSVGKEHNKNIYGTKNDLFYNFFDVGNCFNDSCYECNFRYSSSADLRIGDFWGAKYRKDNTGVSICVSMTPKGETVLKELENNKSIIIEPQSIKDYETNQQIKNYAIPVNLNKIREEFDSAVSLKQLSKKYCDDILLERKLRKCIKRVIER